MTLNIYQTHLITKIIQVFNEYLKSLVTFNNPDTSHEGIVRNQETDTKISHGIHKRYRIGVGSVLYLVKHSLIGLSHALHEP